MSESFFTTLAEVSATVVSILATAIVAYVIYLKQKRDSEGVHIIEQKRRLNGVFDQLVRIPIPGVIAHLLAEPEKKEKPEEPRGLIKIVRWLAGADWWHLAHAERVDRRMASRATEDILEGLTEMADKVVGIPAGVRVPLEQDSPIFRKWARRFLTSSADFAWLWETYGEFGWGRNLMALLNNLERLGAGIPVMRSGDVRNLFETLIYTRTLVEEILFKEQRYQTYKLETGLKFRRWIGLGFIFMAIFGIVIPLLVLLPPVSWFKTQIDVTVIALTSLVGFFGSLSMATLCIWKSVSR